MNRILLLPAALALTLLLGGCGTGIIYTHTYRPLTLDMNHTPVVATSHEGDIKHIQVWVVGVAWDRAGLGEIAKKHGMEELYYADLETLRVLTVWNRYTVHLYGK